MIDLERPKPPHALDDPMVAALVAKYQADGSSVWNTDYIREALLESSNSKCAFCETKLDEESKYMEVDHFRCKKSFKNLVVEWNNLLPSCKRCNGNKSSYNVDVDGMIVNPYDSYPRDHIYIHNARLRHKDQIGRNTIEALYLNQSDRLVAVRAAIAEAVATSLERIREYLEEYQAGKITTRQRNKIVRGMEKLLREAGRSAEYSATTATALLGDPDYAVVKSGLHVLGEWGALEPLEDEAKSCALFL